MGPDARRQPVRRRPAPGADADPEAPADQKGPEPGLEQQHANPRCHHLRIALDGKQRAPRSPIEKFLLVALAHQRWEESSPRDGLGIAVSSGSGARWQGSPAGVQNPGQVGEGGGEVELGGCLVTPLVRACRTWARLTDLDTTTNSRPRNIKVRCPRWN